MLKDCAKKLKQVGIVNWIENVYGIGYRLNPHLTQPASARTEVTQSISSSVEQEFDREMEQMWAEISRLDGRKNEYIKKKPYLPWKWADYLLIYIIMPNNLLIN